MFACYGCHLECYPQITFATILNFVKNQQINTVASIPKKQENNYHQIQQKLCWIDPFLIGQSTGWETCYRRLLSDGICQIVLHFLIVYRSIFPAILSLLWPML
jgi:hypothetical protein